MIYLMVLKRLSEMRWKTSMTKDSQGILLGKHIFQAIKCFFIWLKYEWVLIGIQALQLTIQWTKDKNNKDLYEGFQAGDKIALRGIMYTNSVVKKIL